MLGNVGYPLLSAELLKDFNSILPLMRTQKFRLIEEPFDVCIEYVTLYVDSL